MASVSVEVSVVRHACLTISKQLLHPPLSCNVRRISVTLEQKKQERTLWSHTCDLNELSLCVSP